uniref:RNA1 polyprotein n=1 Tax=Camellia comovirus TaxID=3115807 RepID=A0AAT9J7U3_9SECO
MAIQTRKLDQAAQVLNDLISIGPEIYIQRRNLTQNRSRTRAFRKKHPDLDYFGMLAFMLDEVVHDFPRIRPEEFDQMNLIQDCMVAYQAWDREIEPLYHGLGMNAIKLYIEMTFCEYLQCTVRFDAPYLRLEPAVVPDEQYAIAQGLGAAVSAMSQVFLSKLKKGVEWTIDTVLARIRKHFDETIRAYCPFVIEACSWINGIWERIKEWIIETCDKTLQFLGAVRELIIWGCAAAGIAAILCLLERFLLASNLIKSPIGLAKSYMGLVAASLGLFAGYKACSEVNARLVLFARDIMLASCTTLVSLYGEEAVAEALNRAQGQFNPVAMLEGIAKVVADWNGAGLHTIGRSFSAVNSIKNGITATWQMAAYILNKIGEFYQFCFGQESKVLNDLSHFFGMDVERWLRKADCVMEEFLLRGWADQEGLITMLALKRQGADMVEQFVTAGRKNKSSATFANVITKTLEKLNKSFVAASLHGKPQTRKKPFTIFFTGPSRTGKSILSRTILYDFLNQWGLDEDAVHSYGASSNYWDCYRRQPIVTIDDFGAAAPAGGANIHEQFMDLVSNAPCHLNMAGLEEKGMLFDSRLFICASNFIDPVPDSGVKDFPAFRNRKMLNVEVTRKEGTEYDPTNPTESQQYQLYTIKDTTGEVTRGRIFQSYDDLFAYCLNSYNEYDKKEEQELVSIRAKLQNRPQKATLSNLLDLGLLYSSVTREKLIEINEYHEGGSFFFVDSENTMWAWNAKKQDCEVMDNRVKWDIEMHEKLKALSHKNLIAYYQILTNFDNMHTSLAIYMQDILDADLIGPTGVIKQCPKDLLEGLVLQQLKLMPLWQRIILREVRLHHYARKDRSALMRLMRAVKGTLCELYRKEISEWPLLLKVAVGIVLATIGATSMWKVFSFLRGLGSGSAFAANASMAFSAGNAAAQSWRPNHQSGPYRYRNQEVRPRSWAKGQADFESSHVMIMEHCLGVLKVGSFVTQICILPGHKFISFGHFVNRLGNRMMAVIHTASREYHIVLDKSLFTSFDGSDLVVYTSPQVENIPSSAWKYFCFDWESRAVNSCEALFLSCKYSEFAATYVPEFAPIVARQRKRNLNVYGGEYTRMVPTCLEYEAPTEDMDCGSLVVTKIATKDGPVWQIIGIHVAGDGTFGFANFIPPVEQEAEAQCAGDYFEFFPLAAKHGGSGCSIVGQAIPGKTYINVPKKTALCEMEEVFHLGTPITKVPAILSGDDPRIPESCAGYCPFSTGMMKYAYPMKAVDPVLLDKVTDEILETWFEANDGFDFQEVTTEVAINGLESVEYFDALVMSTSEGFPYVMDRKYGQKGKSRYISGETGALFLTPGTLVEANLLSLEEECKTKVPELICIECPKDEKLVRRKVFEKPKTRLFSILPMDFNLCVRKKFLKFVRFLMLKRSRLPCKVGINCFSTEWGQLADHLLSKGNQILCCDYSSFDGLLSKQIMEAIADTINLFCGGSQVLCAQRKNLLMACCQRFGICKQALYRVECGIPSGFPLTVILNSIFNEILVRMAYKHIMTETVGASVYANSFNQMIALAVYGDDNLISVSPIVAPFFNGASLKQFMANLGITITDGVDKTLPSLNFRKIEDCDFLKRGFVQKSATIWDCPQEEESIWSQLHYVQDKNLDKLEAYKVNLNNVLREVYLHSPQKMKELRRKAFLQLPFLRGEEIVTCDQIEDFFQDQRGLQLLPRSDCTEFIFDVSRLGPIVHPTEVGVEQPVELIPGVFVQDVKYVKEEPNQLLVLCNTRRKVVANELACAISWAPGEGRGMLPTTYVVKSLFQRKSELRKKIHQAIVRKDKVIFCASVNTVPALVLATCFLYYNGNMERTSSNVLLTAAIDAASSLKYLVKDFPDLFIGKVHENIHVVNN